MSATVEDLVVIGAGPAGLCAAAAGSHRGWTPVVIDRAPTIGGMWAQVRPEMRCLSPRWRDRLPDGSTPTGPGPRASAGEVLATIEAFAARLAPRLQLGCEATGLSLHSQGLLLNTTKGPLLAHRVMVATGQYGRPRSLQLPGHFNGPIVHSSAFSPQDVGAGERVLVIGAGNSGAEVAEVACARGASVIIAATAPIAPPPAIRRGIIEATLFALSGLPIDRLPFRAGCRDTTPLINPWLYQSVVRGTVELVGPATELHSTGVEIAGGRRIDCDRIVVAIGFLRDTAWLAPTIQLSADGIPQHRRGVARDVAGLGFLGIPCLRTRRSGFLRGLADDGEAVIAELA